ncbi:MAG: hypothetical protein ABIH66_09585 [bacterium]
METSMGNATYLNTILSKAAQIQGQVLLNLLAVNEKVETVQAKPLGNLSYVPESSFEAVA